LVGEPAAKRPLGKCKHTLEYDMERQEIGW
jgi:hypothetical protein